MAWDGTLIVVDTNGTVVNVIVGNATPPLVVQKFPDGNFMYPHLQPIAVGWVNVNGTFTGPPTAVYGRVDGTRTIIGTNTPTPITQAQLYNQGT